MRKYLAPLGVFVFLALAAYSIAWADQARIESRYGDLTGANSPLVTYNDEKLGYTLTKPASWNVHTIPSMAYMRIENLDPNSLSSLPIEVARQYFKIEVVVLPADGLSLNDWVDRQNTTSYPLPKIVAQTPTVVGGEVAVYQFEQFGSFVHPVVFIKKNDQIYLINISSNSNVFKAVTDAFLKNFSFNS